MTPRGVVPVTVGNCQDRRCPIWGYLSGWVAVSGALAFLGGKECLPMGDEPRNCCIAIMVPPIIAPVASVWKRRENFCFQMEEKQQLSSKVPQHVGADIHSVERRGCGGELDGIQGWSGE